jgi:type II secretory pathway component GspD/PulD (secretin)
MMELEDVDFYSLCFVIARQQLAWLVYFRPDDTFVPRTLEPVEDAPPEELAIDLSVARTSPSRVNDSRSWRAPRAGAAAPYSESGSIAHSAGINLLDGLTVQFGLDYATEEKWMTGAPTAFTRLFTTALRVPEITYSLNLFNTKDDFYRVITRPSLVASLHETSEFFIGRTVSVAVSSINLGDIQLIDLGTYVRVTPVTISPTEAQFKIEVIRSFPIENAPGTFEQSLTAFKQTVTATAEVEFGKTLILSGLYEGVDPGGYSKTPGVGDVPGVDTFFNARRRQERRDVALVLVTPKLVGFVDTATRDGAWCSRACWGDPRTPERPRRRLCGGARRAAMGSEYL